MASELPTKLHLQIISTVRSVVNAQVDEVEIPGAEGYFGVLPGHTPLLALLGSGEMWYRQGNQTTYLALSGGFAEVLPDRVTMLTRIAERPDEIDVARAEAAKKRAEDRIAAQYPDIDYERARLALFKALMRLQVATRVRVRV